MNAKDAVIEMKNDLAAVGYTVNVVEETENKIAYAITSNTTQWFETNEMFFLAAYKSDVTNRWNKYFSYTAYGFGVDTSKESNLTYKDMQFQIHMSIKYRAKVGA
jgi:hypothetical protein